MVPEFPSPNFLFMRRREKDRDGMSGDVKCIKYLATTKDLEVCHVYPF